MEWLDSIKKLKKEKKMTNEQLSQLSGISLGTLNKLLAGATDDPKLSTLLALARAFDCPMDEMLGRSTSGIAPGDEMMKKYASLDPVGKEAADYIINKEYARSRRTPLRPAITREEVKTIRTLRLYNTAVSAGTGSFLFDSDYTDIHIYNNAATADADFAVRVSGDSMNPRYQNGDILLVSQTAEVEPGDFGIFELDGESYFKKFGGDRLISLNPDYSDIPLEGASSFSCFGRVIGKLKR